MSTTRTMFAERVSPLVTRYKGLDADLFLRSRPDSRDAFWQRLVKELTILAETARPGAARDLDRLLDHAAQSEKPLADLEPDITALVEFGKCYSDVAPHERAMVDRHEIAQEFGHFSRIMGLDRILQNDTASLSADDAWNATNDFARFLTLLVERRAERGLDSELVQPQKVDVSVGGALAVSDAHGILRKNGALNVVGMLAPASGGSLPRPMVKELLTTFDRLLSKHSFDISCALLDYYAFLHFPDSDVRFLATQEYVRGGVRKITVFDIGGNSCLIVQPKAGGAFYERDVVRWIRHPAGTGDRLGAPSGAEFGRETMVVPENGTAYMLTVPMTECLSCLGPDELSGLLNQADVHGKILAFNNIQGYCARRGTVGTVVQQHIGVAREAVPIVWTTSVVRDRVDALALEPLLASSHPVCVEAAHVHADRPLGQAQRDGARIAVALGEALEQRGRPSPTFITMVDEYHVLNRLDYADFLREVDVVGFHPTEVVFEGSPLLREVAADLLKYFLRRSRMERGRVTFDGQNVYLHLAQGRGIVELIEDMHQRFVVGCVLFDAALCYYKRYHTQLQETYRQTHGLPSSYEVHREMLRIYERVSDPVARAKTVAAEIPLQRWDIASVQSSLAQTSYIDAVARSSAESRRVALVNVLEEFYRPQQAKLNAVLSLLDADPLFSLYCGPSGELRLEQTMLDTLKNRS